MLRFVFRFEYKNTTSKTTCRHERQTTAGKDLAVTDSRIRCEQDSIPYLADDVVRGAAWDLEDVWRQSELLELVEAASGTGLWSRGEDLVEEEQEFGVEDQVKHARDSCIQRARSRDVPQYNLKHAESVMYSTM